MHLDAYWKINHSSVLTVWRLAGFNLSFCWFHFSEVKSKMPNWQAVDVKSWSFTTSTQIHLISFKITPTARGWTSTGGSQIPNIPKQQFPGFFQNSQPKSLAIPNMIPMIFWNYVYIYIYTVYIDIYFTGTSRLSKTKTFTQIYSCWASSGSSNWHTAQPCSSHQLSKAFHCVA